MCPLYFIRGSTVCVTLSISVFLAHSCDTGHLLERQSGRTALKMGSDCELAGIKELNYRAEYCNYIIPAAIL